MHPLGGGGLSGVALSRGGGDNARLDRAVLDHTRQLHKKKLISLGALLVVLLVGKKIWTILTYGLPLMALLECFVPESSLHVTPTLLPLLARTALVFPFGIFVQWLIFQYLEEGAYVELEELFPPAEQGMGDIKRFMKLSFTVQMNCVRKQLSPLYLFCLLRRKWRQLLVLVVCSYFFFCDLENAIEYYLHCSFLVSLTWWIFLNTCTTFHSDLIDLLVLAKLCPTAYSEASNSPQEYWWLQLKLAAIYFVIFGNLMKKLVKDFDIPCEPKELLELIAGRFGWDPRLEAVAFLFFLGNWLWETGNFLNDGEEDGEEDDEATEE